MSIFDLGSKIVKKFFIFHVSCVFADGFIPSAALVKAMLINSAQPVMFRQSADDAMPPQPLPFHTLVAIAPGLISISHTHIVVVSFILSLSHHFHGFIGLLESIQAARSAI